MGEVYVTWGGYAYSRRTYGREAQDTFRRRLATVAATVKNEDSREVDMFDSDDFYSYHGGMVAAVKAIKGELPLSFSGDSSDPRRVGVITAQLLEAIERGMWQARPETAAALKELYLDIEGELEARTE